jgi:hypothetical protein
MFFSGFEESVVRMAITEQGFGNLDICTALAKVDIESQRLK